MTTFAINGFGRIGRTSFRVWFQSFRDRLDLRAINTSGSMDLKGVAHLLKYDTNYGVFSEKIGVDEHQSNKSVTDEDPLLGHLTVGSKQIAVFAQKDPSKLPWLGLQIHTVIEATGHFTSSEKASAHLTAGASRVLISAPPSSNDIGVYVLGVNKASGFGVESNASCTTNCVAPVMAVLQEAFGVEKALMSTIHSFTDDQNLQDNSHKDLRRARSAGQNIVPTTTGAARAGGQTISDLKGIFDGVSYRVPTPTGSLSDVVCLLKRNVSVEEINRAFMHAALLPRWKNILAVTDEPLVSHDIVGRSESAIVDLALTQVVGENLVRVVAWYDNEWGYCNRLIEQLL